MASGKLAVPGRFLTFANEKGERNLPGSYVRGHYLELLRKRVEGQALDDGIWHGLMDLVKKGSALSRQAAYRTAASARAR